VAMRVRVRSDAHSHTHASDLTYPQAVRHIHVKMCEKVSDKIKGNVVMQSQRSNIIFECFV
jgi:hypothetical protein